MSPATETNKPQTPLPSIPTNPTKAQLRVIKEYVEKHSQVVKTRQDGNYTCVVITFRDPTDLDTPYEGWGFAKLNPKRDAGNWNPERGVIIAHGRAAFHVAAQVVERNAVRQFSLDLGTPGIPHEVK